jgi:hypothetical protein
MRIAHFPAAHEKTKQIPFHQLKRNGDEIFSRMGFSQFGNWALLKFESSSRYMNYFILYVASWADAIRKNTG